ncbi:hypothetical protein JCM10213_004755 [Rhodosporidiobolus nylandii]
MAAARIPIAFDVLGTCFSFSAARDALVKVFPHLSQDHAQAVIDDWFHSSQRDFTYLSMNSAYTPIAKVLKANLPRNLLMANLVPSSAAEPGASSFDWSSVVDPITSTIPSMAPRPGLAEATELLLSSNFRLLAATNGGLDTTKGLYEKALGKETAQKWEYFSCDEDKAAKPAPTVYRDVWKRFGIEEDAKDKLGWFVASHTWDLFAARKAGFKTAFVTYEEHLVLEDIWGKPDVVAKDLEDAARQIIAKEGR